MHKRKSTHTFAQAHTHRERVRVRGTHMQINTCIFIYMQNMEIHRHIRAHRNSRNVQERIHGTTYMHRHTQQDMQTHKETVTRKEPNA